jgi:cytochrome c551/c552
VGGSVALNFTGEVALMTLIRLLLSAVLATAFTATESAQKLRNRQASDCDGSVTGDRPHVGPSHASVASQIAERARPVVSELFIDPR